MPRSRKLELDVSKGAVENSKIFIKERYELMKWNSSVEIKPPNLLIPVQIANYMESLPFCRITVSPKLDRLALMSHARLLDIYAIFGETLDHESSVQTFDEPAPEYCRLQFSSSGTLLLSSRSSPHIDVFDQMGVYCYDIILGAPQGSFDVNVAVCGMQTVPYEATSPSDKFFELLYVLQYNGTFSAFKIGRLAKYERQWTICLDVGLTGSFVVVPQFNLLLVAVHHRSSGKVNPPGGLSSFRLIESEPHVEPIRVGSNEEDWWLRFPFTTPFMTYLPNLSVSPSAHLLVSVSTNGSLFLFEVPSTRLKFHYNYINGPRPVQAAFVEDNDIGVIFDNGTLMRCSPEELEEKMHSMKTTRKKGIDAEENEKLDVYTEHTILTVPTPRDIFLLSSQGDNSVLREAAHKRVSLAGRLWIFTLWNSFKQLLGMAMGEVAEPLQMATHVARFDFVLMHSPTRSLQELFERTLLEHDYSRARELASIYESIDSDVVLKSEWCELCRKAQVGNQHVADVLEQVVDTEWVARQCASAAVEDIDVQTSLVELGLALDEELVSVVWRVQLLHNARMLAVCSDATSFLAARDLSCLQAAVQFARRADLETLHRLISTNFVVLTPFEDVILSSIPCCIQPSRYENFLPSKDPVSGAFTPWDVDDAPNEYSRRLDAVSGRGADLAMLVRAKNIGDDAVPDSEFDYVSWVRRRVREIDFECGLTKHASALLSISISRGFVELEKDVVELDKYAMYIDLCVAISESIGSFENAPVKSLVDRFSRLMESELVANVEKIIDILDWKVANSRDSNEPTLRSHLQSLLVRATERNTKVLAAFRQRRPDLVDKDMITECLLNMTTTGGELLQAMHGLPMDDYSRVSSALGSLLSRGVKMTFKAIYDSMNDADGARRVLIKLTRSGHCESLEEWAALRDDVVEMAEGIFEGLIETDEALELLAKEVLEDERVGHMPELMSMVLTIDSHKSRSKRPTKPIEQRVAAEGESSRKLNAQKSSEVLLAKSRELMSEATHRDDPLLGRSRFFAIAAREIAPKQAAEQLRWLDAVELAQELGCTMMPVGIKESAHGQLLADIVHLGSNYKQGKKCAKLAQLLGVDTPVATALSHCALAALRANDATYLSRYIGEVIDKARGLPVVHQLCLQIMDSPHVPTDMNDIFACAIMNCSDMNLMATMEAINRSNSVKEATKLAATRIHPDERMFFPVSGDWVQDPMYTSLEKYRDKLTSSAVQSDVAKFKAFSKSLTLRELAKVMAHESATCAMAMALMDDFEENSWTTNDQLMRYEKAIRFFGEQHKAPFSTIADIPVDNLLAAAGQQDETITAMDRLSDYGCDRSRFVGDKEYRNETIVGLALTENEQQFADALELADKYNVDTWQLHMASLENALTSLTIAEAKQILKARGHLIKLRTRVDDFHAKLRSSVLSLLTSNEQFIAYLSLFADCEPEKKATPVLKKILEKKKDVKAVRMFTDAKYLAGVIISIPDKILWTLVDGLLTIPVGQAACELAARQLLDGTDVRPPAHPLTLFLLLRSDDEELLELIAVKPRNDEIEYLERASMLLAATPNTPAKLRDCIDRRLNSMKQSSRGATASPENGSDEFAPFGHSDSSSSIMNRRRR